MIGSEIAGMAAILARWTGIYKHPLNDDAIVEYIRALAGLSHEQVEWAMRHHYQTAQGGMFFPSPGDIRAFFVVSLDELLGAEVERIELNAMKPSCDKPQKDVDNEKHWASVKIKGQYAKAKREGTLPLVSMPAGSPNAACIGQESHDSPAPIPREADRPAAPSAASEGATGQAKKAGKEEIAKMRNALRCVK